MTETEKAKIAYAMWRKREKNARKGGANLMLGLAIGSIVLIWILIEAEADVSWLLAAQIPVAFVALLAMVYNSRADQIPVWNDLLQEFEYETWKLSEQAEHR